MGSFSPVHWIIFAAMLAVLGAVVYFVGSLIWAGVKATGSKKKLIAAIVLLPLAILIASSFIDAAKPPPQNFWEKGSTPVR